VSAFQLMIMIAHVSWFLSQRPSAGSQFDSIYIQMHK
jgi:hypothetical protein